MVSVFVVSSSPSRRDVLRHALGSEEVRVVGEADPRVTIDGARPAGAVLVLDGEEALEAVVQAEDEWPAALVLLADRPEPGTIDELRRLDAPGWAVLPAGAGADRLRAAILAASAGMAAVPIEWRDELRGAGPGRHAEAEAAEDSDVADADDEGGLVHESLTFREAEVLGWMARGLSNREIGIRLGISEHTAKFHVASVLGKLGAHNRADAVRRGVRRGIVTV